MASDPLDPGHLFHHVQDAHYFELPRNVKLKIPQPINSSGESLVEMKTGIELLDRIIEPPKGMITKFMVLEVVAGLLVCILFIALANRMRKTGQPRGTLWNLLESMLVFIRDQVARPAIGKHDADRFLPFLWTMFFFVLFLNLLGMVPWAGSATGALATTGALALVAFCATLSAGISKLGLKGFLKSQVPHMELPFVLAIVLVPGIFILEMVGMVIKHFVLAVRLLANMMAGHLVLAVLLAFIVASHPYGGVWYVVTPASVLGATALSVLELFVAFLQAYIFTFLSALFIGTAVHPH